MGTVRTIQIDCIIEDSHLLQQKNPYFSVFGTLDFGPILDVGWGDQILGMGGGIYFLPA